MENDLILKCFLINDNTLNKIEMKLALDFLKCKLDNCYSNKRDNIRRITHEDYEECKENCIQKLNKFNMLKVFLYQDFNKFYYEKFLACANELDEKKYSSCIDNSKKLMKKNVDDIKKIILNYKY
jgi:hypothetical protein